MPYSDYTSALGGALKLKGANVTKKKKKKSKQSNTETTSIKEPSPPRDRSSASKETRDASPTTAVASTLQDEDELLRAELEKDMKEHGRTKTDAERRFEEQRRKRLDERLKRDGVKTHKERVEELNRYLSRLSEHHDMPRIGPG